MLKPLGNRVVIEAVEENKTTESGIVIPDSDKKSIKGKVIFVGEGKIMDDGKKKEMSVKVGDIVLFNEYSTTDVKIDGKELKILTEDDILAVIN